MTVGSFQFTVAYPLNITNILSITWQQT